MRRWPGPPRPAPARTATPRLASPRTTSASSRSPRSTQKKFAWLSAELSPSSLELLRDPQPLDRVALDAPGDVVLMAERLRRRGLGELVDGERLADAVDRLRGTPREPSA